MKITLVDNEFQDMADAWVYKNLVEKSLVDAKVVDGVIELEVIGEGDSPPEAEKMTAVERLDKFEEGLRNEG